MRLQLRRFSAVAAADGDFFDEEYEVRSQAEWLQRIYQPDVLCSIVWPEPPLFALTGPNYLGRRHPHEKGYFNDPTVNASYREGCRRLAARLDPLLDGRRCLVYLPLRGALPIWRGIRQFLQPADCTPYHAVTSSFVFYPESFRVLNRKGRPASGRFAHVLEMQRVQPILAHYDVLLYVDEIVSGGMMHGYLEDMFALGIDRRIRIIAAGLADACGERSVAKRQAIERHAADGRLAFLWEGCNSLITEDHRALLGMHYVDYRLGPHSVPLLLGTVPPAEKIEFDREVFDAA